MTPASHLRFARCPYTAFFGGLKTWRRVFNVISTSSQIDQFVM
jgi:hypothetical protein